MTEVVLITRGTGRAQSRRQSSRLATARAGEGRPGRQGTVMEWGSEVSRVRLELCRTGTAGAPGRGC